MLVSPDMVILRAPMRKKPPLPRIDDAAMLLALPGMVDETAIVGAARVRRPPLPTSAIALMLESRMLSYGATRSTRPADMRLVALAKALSPEIDCWNAKPRMTP